MNCKRLQVGLSFLLLLLIAGLAPAQEFRATISGRVLDASNAGVPNTVVTAKHTATNEVSTATTDASGNYTIPFLRPGVYEITAEATGFKQFRRENVTVEVGKLIGIDISMEVGAVTESVTVTSEVPLLETATASRVGVVTTKQVAELPLNSRNPFMLGAMMSGVTFRGAAIWQRPFDNGAIAEWSVNGGRQSNNEFLMDGAPNNGQAGGNNIAYVPIVDAVQEFSVQQNSYDSGYGHTGGGVFNVVLKSGTSDFHFTGWEFLRRKWMDANTFQNNALGRNPDGSEKAPRAAHRLDQYGWQLDGPLVIPKLLKKEGRIRGFFLGSYEGYYEEWPQFLRNSFPEPEMREGDFSRLRTAPTPQFPQGQAITIFDPLTTSFAPNGDPIRSPFPNNRIPAERINPVARALLKYIPLPNGATTGVRYSTQNHLRPDYAATDDYYNLILKFDFNIGDNHRTFFRHASNDRQENRCINGICAGPGMDGQQPFERTNDAYVLDWVWTKSPSLVFNVRGSHNRFIEKGFGEGNVDFDLTSLGLPASLVSQLPSPAFFGRWEFNGVYSVLGRSQGNNITNNYGIAGTVTKIAGSHSMRFGVDLRRIHFIRRDTGNILFFDGRTQWTQRVYNQGSSTEGDPFASFLIGGISGSSNYPVYPFFRQWYFAPYFQDDWKISQRLTVNIGLRWDYNGAPDEKYNRINRGFNPNAASPLASQIPADMLARYPELRNLKGGLEFAGVNGNPRTVAKNDMNNLQPRIGAAYRVTERLVMRGGYGLYYLNPNNDYHLTTGFSTNTPIVNSLDGGRTLLPNLLQNPYPRGISTPAGSSLGYLTFAGDNSTWFNPESFRTPKVHQFSFGFQRQLTNNGTLEFSYVGSRTVGANSERDFNIPSAEFRKQCNLLEGGSPAFCNQTIPNPFRGIEAFRGRTFFDAATVSRFQMARPFPQFNGNMLERGRNDSKIWYNSFQVNYNHRVGSDLTLLANYTLSKMVERWGFNDPYTNEQQQGLYFNDRPHFLKFSTVWELPIGKGKRIAPGAGGLVGKLISGWQFSTYTQWSSGEPNNLPGNAIMLKDPRTKGGDWTGEVDWTQHKVVGWNPCVLRQFNDGRIEPQPFSISRGCGTDPANYAWLMTADYAPRFTPFRSGQIRKQSLFNTDMALSKMTSITERLKVQFRIEAFNATNYYFFGRGGSGVEGFETNPNSEDFGVIYPNRAWIGNGYPRQMQIGIKLFW